LLAVTVWLYSTLYDYLQTVHLQYSPTVQYSCIIMNIPKFLDIKISIPVPPI
jgi:hypothetical protein